MQKEFDITDIIKQLDKEGKIKTDKPWKTREEYLIATEKWKKMKNK